MSLKQHFIIVMAIVFAVIILWRVFLYDPPQIIVEVESPYAIEIARASFGLNCLQSYQQVKPNQKDSFAFGPDGLNTALKNNNALSVVSDACNGRVNCEIRVANDFLGIDPAPKCLHKELVVEYRCFAYDRPWEIAVKQGKKLVIDCRGR